jgi:hypothetical protein
MPKYLVGTGGNCNAWLNRIDQLNGCPIKGKGHGNGHVPDEPGIGWTLTCCWKVLASPTQATLEVPDDQLQHLGKPGLPPASAAMDVTELPPELRTLVYARHGLDADGNPLWPLP